MNRDKDCPVQSALDILGGKWKLAIIHALMKRSPMRFKEIERGVKGITPRMLIKELKELEAHGLLSRTHYPTIPPAVEYALTDNGQTTIPLIRELKKWSKKHMKETIRQDPEKIKEPETKKTPEAPPEPELAPEKNEPAVPPNQISLF